MFVSGLFHVGGFDRLLGRYHYDTVWLFFTGTLPPSERWPKPPRGCTRPDSAGLLECPVPIAEIVANARRVLEAVRDVDQGRCHRVMEGADVGGIVV